MNEKKEDEISLLKSEIDDLKKQIEDLEKEKLQFKNWWISTSGENEKLKNEINSVAMIVNMISKSH